MSIDLNCDLGEGAAFDADLMPLVTSANVSCGVHAGDEAIVRMTLRLAKAANVAVGAHPGYDDRPHFGRREMSLDEAAVFDLIVTQIESLKIWANAEGVAIRYLKPHGALYNQACRDDRVARPVVAAAERFGLPILALPRSRLEELSSGRVAFVREGFADRRYRPDGSLVPRAEANSMVTDVAEAVSQAKRLIAESGVRSLCVHGDNPAAVEFARELRRAFVADGFDIRPFVDAV